MQSSPKDQVALVNLGHLAHHLLAHAGLINLLGDMGDDDGPQWTRANVAASCS
jgi:hypothetical protein